GSVAKCPRGHHPMPIAERYEQMFELSPMAMLLVAPDGRIRLANDEFAQLFKYDPNDLLGQPVERLLPKNLQGHHPELREAYQRVPAKRTMGKGRDLYGQTSTGRVIPLELGLHPLETEENGTWTLVTAFDTSARMRGEAMVRATLDAAASAMVMVARDGKIVSMNQAALDLFGYQQDELLGQPVEILLPADVHTAHRVYRNSFFEMSAARTMGSGAKLYGRNKSGDQFRIEAALTPVDLADEKLVLATIIDLSERLAAERAIAEKQAAEAQADRVTKMNNDLTRFAYSASHDLKAPLSTITGILRLSISDLKAGETVEVESNLEKLIDLASSSAEKVESLLKLAQVGHDQSPSVEIDLEQMISQLWDRITLADQEPPALDVTIDMDAALFSVEQAVQIVVENLLSNAHRYRDHDKSESWVRVMARQDREWFHLTVSDNGIGIAPEDQEAVFSMFEKLSERSGHGLGLAVAHRQVDQLGGSITCSGDRGEGAEFYVRLPIRPND
ncbi:MAG: PAS domain-containing sensor histidine kinase, partial [Pseudomonadota bacterium]